MASNTGYTPSVSMGTLQCEVGNSRWLWGEMDTYEVDPASLSYEDVEAIVSNRVKKRVMKTKEFQRQVAKQEKPKHLFAWLWHGFKRAVAWIWEAFCTLMDIIANALRHTIRWLWNNGGESALRRYAARELTALLR